mgnify:CR=1 FL=1
MISYSPICSRMNSRILREITNVVYKILQIWYDKIVRRI